MDLPPKLALAQAVPVLPDRPGLWFEPKYDGHRAAMLRTADTVRLYTRSGRVATSHWMDLATAGMVLEPGTLLDGEIVIWRDGRLDFGAVQARAASSLARARALATRHPASYVVWDVLEHPVHGDVRGRPYTARRELLLDLLVGVGPPIQVTPSTDDRALALLWQAALVDQGVEGIVAKAGGASYPSGARGWVKVRHADTVDARVVGFVGPRVRPTRLALALGGGRPRLSRRLGAGLSVGIGAALAGARVTGPAVASGGEPYTAVDTELVVEVLAGSGRHGTLTVTRAR